MKVRGSLAGRSFSKPSQGPMGFVLAMLISVSNALAHLFTLSCMAK